MNLEQVISRLEGRLQDAGLAFGHDSVDAWEEAAHLVLYAMGIDPPVDDDDEINWSRVLTAEEVLLVEKLVLRRINERVPLAYLVNETWFGGRRFYIDERTIVPRSYLVEWIPEQFSPWVDPGQVHSILDLCTGSGCIAISCALAFPGSRVLASDISGSALEVASINVRRYGMERRISLVQGDGLDAVEGQFDMIVCNPPYVSDFRMDTLPPEFRREPDKAFRGGGDGLDFIVPMLARVGDFMTEQGVIFVESGSASPALEQKFPAIPFTWLSTEHDEMVVFALTRDEIRKYRPLFEQSV